MPISEAVDDIIIASAYDVLHIPPQRSAFTPAQSRETLDRLGGGAKQVLLTRKLLGCHYIMRPCQTPTYAPERLANEVPASIDA